jgi:NADH-quinone oxidoreductase subunit L
VPLLPFIGFLINGLFGKSTKNPGAGWIATLLVFGSFGISLSLLMNVLNAPEDMKRHAVYLLPWLTGPGNHFVVNWELLIDPLSVLMMLIITGVGGLIHLYSIGYMASDKDFTRFFTYLNLFVFFMLLLVMGNNLLILFIGWEGVGLCSYLLIGYFYEKKSAGDAAKKAFIMNRVGDVGVLIGMFMIFHYFGTLDFVKGHAGIAGITELANVGAVTATMSTVVIGTLCLMLFFGATGKSAQIPLYTWLPDAMEGPTPVSALIHAATMVTAGVYMVSRVHGLFEHSWVAMTTVCVIGILTAIFAATIGLAQNDIKRVLAYSTVSQLGYMFAACGAGMFAAGMYHVMTHAFFKACLFLCSGAVIHAVEHGMHAHGHGDGEHSDHAGHGDDAVSGAPHGPDPGDPQDMRNMGGLAPRIPITFGTMLIATLAIAGIFPLAGYWSKDEILWRLFNFPTHSGNWFAEHANWIFWGIGALTALITAFYMFRLIMKTFAGAPRTEAAKSAHESPAVMWVPLVVLAILSAITGWAFMPFEKFADFLAPAVASPGFPPVVLNPGLEKPLGWGVLGVIVLVILICFALYRNAKNAELLSAQTKETSFPYRLLLNKYWVDEAYNFWFVKLGKQMADWLWKTYDEGVVDGIVNGVAWITEWSGAQMRKMQTGYVRNYAFSMVIGILFVLIACIAGIQH